MSSFDNDDDDLTDIRSLPDLNEEQEDSFESLDDIAENLGMTPEKDSNNDQFGNDDFNEPEPSLELPDSPPDFNFEENTEDVFGLDATEEEDSDFNFSENDNNESDLDTESFNNDKEDSEEQENDQQNDFVEEDSFEFDNEDEEGEQDEQETETEDEAEDDYQPKSEFTLEEELTPAPPIEAVTPKTPIVAKSIHTHSTPPEDFEEVKNFARDMSSKNFSTEGNPPFSIILKGIKYTEDAESIIDILYKFKIIDEANKEITMEELSRGTFLIPRLSEYAAIIICHQLRSFDLEILMGLTEEITPPKSYTSNDRGPTSKRTVLANKKHDISMREKHQNNEILTTTLPHFHDCNIVKYLGVASESILVDAEIIQRSDQLEEEIIEQVPDKSQEELKLLKLKKENIDAAESKFGFDFDDIYNNETKLKAKKGLEHIYADLISHLKIQAMSAHANAIVGITFSISPLAVEEYLSQGPKYQILCTGNMVWIEKN